MTPINDLNVYTEGMKKSLEDKLFFLPMIRNKTAYIFDYGCADGILLKEIKKRASYIGSIGYDQSEDMIKQAKDNYNGDILFTSSLQEAVYKIRPAHTTLVLSSVIHEVYSYSNVEKIRAFWDFVLHTGFKYIVIRDFSINETTQKEMIGKTEISKIANTDTYQDYCNKNGPIVTKRDLIHFLLKYRYKENWEREVRENYLPLSTEALLKIIQGSEYKVIYQKNYTLPYLKQKVREDFNLDLEDYTHINLILKLRG